jgi:hypothetical protein
LIATKIIVVEAVNDEMLLSEKLFM